jgi:hypothetical protein
MNENIFLMVLNDHNPIKHNNALIRLDKNDLTRLVVLIVGSLDQALDKLWREPFKKRKVFDLLS